MMFHGCNLLWDLLIGDSFYLFDNLGSLHCFSYIVYYINIQHKCVISFTEAVYCMYVYVVTK